MGGFAAWLRGRGRELDPPATLVLGLDTLGSGTPIVAEAEGALRTHRYRATGPRAGRRGRRPGPPSRTAAVAHRRLDGPAAGTARRHPRHLAPLHGAGLLPHYHHPTDVPAHVDWASVEHCARIAAGT
jgi:hypothetical protein